MKNLITIFNSQVSVARILTDFCEDNYKGLNLSLFMLQRPKSSPKDITEHKIM